MTQASCTVTIQAPDHAIWKLISDFGAAGHYMVGVVDCRVEGQGVGARRSLISADGSQIVERLEMRDAAAQRLSYRLLTDTPFGNCLTTMVLHALGPLQSELVWSASFQPVGLPPSEAVELIEGALADNCLALKQLIEA